MLCMGFIDLRGMVKMITKTLLFRSFLFLMVDGWYSAVANRAAGLIWTITPLYTSYSL